MTSTTTTTTNLGRLDARTSEIIEQYCHRISRKRANTATLATLPYAKGICTMIYCGVGSTGPIIADIQGEFFPGFARVSRINLTRDEDGWYVESAEWAPGTITLGDGAAVEAQTPLFVQTMIARSQILTALRHISEDPHRAEDHLHVIVEAKRYLSGREMYQPDITRVV